MTHNTVTCNSDWDYNGQCSSWHHQKSVLALDMPSSGNQRRGGRRWLLSCNGSGQSSVVTSGRAHATRTGHCQSPELVQLRLELSRPLLRRPTLFHSTVSFFFQTLLGSQGLRQALLQRVCTGSPSHKAVRGEDKKRESVTYLAPSLPLAAPRLPSACS